VAVLARAIGILRAEVPKAMIRVRRATAALVVVPAFLFAAALATPAGSAVVVASSTFDADADGWTVAGEAVGPDYHATGGKAGGYISAVDPAGSTGTSYWQAPAKFLGNVSQAFNGRLSFDIRDAGAGRTYGANDVVLQSGSLVLAYHQSKRPKAKSWTHVSVKLGATKGWLDWSTRLRPTPQQMQSALASLDRLIIRGEFRNGPETLAIDNVVMRAKPQ
jgi:hypothetical protein